MTRSLAHFSGSGPGARTRDGCSVALYAQLPYLGELDESGLRLEAGTTVLELGCGTGRLTRRMLEAGADVTAVDNSHEMLQSVPDDATKVLSDVETLDLGRTFDVVLLASGLINHPDEPVRRAFAACARRHLQEGGSFLVQRQDPDWLRDAQIGRAGGTNDLAIHVEAVARTMPLVTMTLRYAFGTDVWRQSFTVVSLSEAEVESLLTAAGFTAFAWRGPKRRWLHAHAGVTR